MKKPLKLVTRKTAEGLVPMCEELLRKAQAGEIRSVGVVTVTVDGDIATAYSRADGDLPILLGASSVLHDRLLD